MRKKIIMRLPRYLILAVLVSAGLLGLLILHWLQPAVPVPVEGIIQPGESSIQEAIDRATKGAVIQLAAGTWQENIRINRSLTLQGAGTGKTIIDGIKKGYPVIWIEATGKDETIEVKLEGLTITGAEEGDADPDARIGADGILIQGEVRVSITNSTITKNRHGIELRDLAQAEITGTTFSGNSHGVVLWESARAEISNSTISGDKKGAGILLWDSSHASFPVSYTHLTLPTKA